MGKINDSASRMQKLIEDLLAFSGSTAASIDAFEEVDLNAVLKGVQLNYSDTIQAGQLIIEAGKLPVVQGMAFQFQQLIDNLIGKSFCFRRIEGGGCIGISG